MEDKDSTTAKQLFTGVDAQYLQLQSKLQSPIDLKIANPLKEYLPGVDSMQTALNFLSKPNNPLSSLLPSDKLSQIQGVGDQLQQLQGRLQQANELKQFISEREQQLKEQLSKLGLGKQLLGMNKEVYYYQQQLQEYKNILHDPKALEQKALAVVRGLPAFQSFWQRNSYLSQLFGVPSNYGDPSTLVGLQTRTQVQQLIQQSIGNSISAAGGATMNPQQYIQGQMQDATQQLSQMRDKVNNLINGGNSSMEMPGFKPNSQRNKSFLKRIQLGWNVQTEKNNYTPTITDFGIMAGYKLGDNKTIGVGVTYKLGWGDGLNHIHFSSQGVGMRSFVDIKAKGSIWVSGGFEYNYMQSFKSLQELHSQVNVWQRSVLLGLTKKYKVRGKDGNFQLLYDFLAYKQVPNSQPLKFRIGYSF